MDIHELLHFALYGALLVIGYLLKKEHDKVTELGTEVGGLKQELNDHKLTTAKEFATKSELENAIVRIERGIESMTKDIGRRLENLSTLSKLSKSGG